MLEYRPFPDRPGRNARQERLEVPLMLRALGVPRGARILEVGCGSGVALPVLQERLAPARLVGLDIDAGMLARAPGRRAELVCGDVRAMPFGDDAFDAVIDFGTCYHIARAERALQEIARVLRPGGSFCHETPLAQLLSHPVRRRPARTLPWSDAPELVACRWAGLSAVRRRAA